ncbi:helix-turn-helix transcriptional regulator [Aureibaculum algae]|uniref:Helix-turn-helix transcriptional regulator n=1 Tax=Aureibaculum algae TaxID=2584122 RepID=A0A5B7TXW9_9FLAO|nr:AraC family transcriptional regulator [Aureibaculum algae]QCX39996.1 helix-turn-helix transcriptional regulator [Aureibaculum algae]
MPKIDLKNNAESPIIKNEVEDGIHLLKSLNESNDIQTITHDIDSSYIQFHFCLKGSSKFLFNNGNYSFDIADDNSLLLYNPQTDLPLNLDLPSKSWVISLFISIKKFHSLFSQEADFIHFLTNDNRDKKYYDTKVTSPALSVVLNQMINFNINSSLEKLYLKGKIYELLSLYFNHGGEADIEQCPFLVDEQNVLKIRKAKDIIIANMTEPPSLQDLANDVDLNLKKLKTGFKQIYGDTVYSFLFDYKMEVARKLLETNKFNVNEVGLKVGYSTSSHFIAAFKKKYGTTPKKYVLALQS